MRPKTDTLFSRAAMMLLTLVMAFTATTAQAAEKTVTYTISYTGTNTLTATPNVAGFDNSTEVIKGPAISGSNDNFGLFLHDNIDVIFNLQNSSGDRRMYVSNDGITFNFAANITVACSNYYIKHIAMKDHNGTAIMVYDLSLPPQEQTNFSFDLNVDLDKLNADGAPTTVREYHVRTANTPPISTTIKTIAITYSDSPRPYSITYTNAVDGNNGVTNNNRDVYYVNTTNFNITAPTRTGYTLSGMTYTDAAHTSATAATLPMTISRGDAATRKAITFVASWTANQYTVTLDGQGATTTGSEAATATYDAAMPSITPPTRTGYTFGGYYTETNGGGTQYYNADGTSARKWNIAAATTLYAKWTANTCTVTLDDQGATTTGSESATATYDAAMPDITIPAKTGYTFGGYYTETNGGGTQYYNADGTSAHNWNFTEATTLYAQWTPITYTLRLHHNDGTGDCDNIDMTYDESYYLDPIDREDYVFSGWSMTENGSVEYGDQEEVMNLTAEQGAVVDLYAQWANPTGTCSDEATTWEYNHATRTLTIGGSGYVEEHSLNYAPWYDYQEYIETVIIGSDIVEIHQFAFSGCSALTNVSGGSGLNYVQPDAFSGSPWETAAKENTTDVTYIGHLAYIGNSVSGDVTIKDGTYRIIEHAFDDNSDITSVTIPASVTVIGNDAFQNCTALATVNILGTTPPILDNSYAFYLESNTSLHRTFNVRSAAYKTADEWADIYNKEYPYSSHSNFQMRVVSTLALPANVSADATPVTIAGTDYYAEDTPITLSPADGYILTDVTVNGTAATDNGDGTWSFTMPDADAIVTATVSEDPNAPVAILTNGSTTTPYYIDGTNTTAEAALKAALDAARYSSGSTVTLLRNVTLATDSYIDCWSDNLILDLNGHSITGNNESQVLVLSGITITGGSITNTGSGAAIISNGTNTITDCTITGNTAIYKYSPDNLTVTNCTITGTSYGIRLEHQYAYLTLNGCTITGNVGIYFETDNSQSFIGNTIKGCAFAGILINGNVKFKGLPHFGTGSEANGCDIVSADKNTIVFQSTSQAGYYAVPATPITVKAVKWNTSTKTYDDKKVGAGYESYTFATGYSNIKDPNTNTTIPIEKVFKSLNPDYIVRNSLYAQRIETQLTKPIVLADNADNTSTIGNYGDCAVTLQGRTLYKDGCWNTLCVPFRTNYISTTPLAGAEIRSLSSASLSADGTLTLNFSDPVAQSYDQLEAGKPYIIKWTKADDYVDDDAHNLVNPYFPSVAVMNATNNFTSEDGTVQFKGTYDPITFDTTDKSILFMGAENTLYYPEAGASINAFRAYFQLTDPNATVRAFVLNFGDDTETQGIKATDYTDLTDKAGAWYTIDGVRLSGKPTKRSAEGRLLPTGRKKGLYIHQGRKVVIK